MAEIELTTMSAKGQIVIPSELRKDFDRGEKFVIIKSGKQLILKSTKYFEEKLKEDLEFAKRTEEALKRYEKGLFKSMSGEEFLKQLEKW